MKKLRNSYTVGLEACSTLTTRLEEACGLAELKIAAVVLAFVSLAVVTVGVGFDIDAIRDVCH